MKPRANLILGCIYLLPILFMLWSMSLDEKVDSFIIFHVALMGFLAGANLAFAIAKWEQAHDARAEKRGPPVYYWEKFRNWLKRRCTRRLRINRKAISTGTVTLFAPQNSRLRPRAKKRTLQRAPVEKKLSFNCFFCKDKKKGWSDFGMDMRMSPCPNCCTDEYRNMAKRMDEPSEITKDFIEKAHRYHEEKKKEHHA